MFEKKVKIVNSGIWVLIFIVIGLGLIFNKAVDEIITHLENIEKICH